MRTHTKFPYVNFQASLSQTCKCKVVSYFIVTINMRIVSLVEQPKMWAFLLYALNKFTQKIIEDV
jgi:hypothetical protein